MRHTITSRFLVPLLLLGACEGAIADIDDPGDPSFDDPDIEEETSVCDPAARGLDFEDSRRLTRMELANTLSALFPESMSADVEAALALIPEEAYGFLPERMPRAFSPAHVDGLVQATTNLAAVAVEDAAFLAMYGCTELNERSCVAGLVEAFGTRAHRRPVEADEVERLMAGWDESGDIPSLLQAIMLSPRFALLFEDLGSPESQRVRLDGYEIASRISYAALEGPPDAALLDAAATGQLETLEGVRMHVERLLASEAGKARVRRFFRSWMEVEALPTSAVTEAFRGDIDVPRLHDDALQDFDRFVDHVVWDTEGDLEALFADPTVFPTSAELAEVYGVVGTDGEAQRATTPHQGILLRAATLMGGPNQSPIIRRGVFLRQRVLCDELGVPDQDVITSRDEDVDPAETDHTLNTNRDVVASMTRRDACMACHVHINPLGFALEEFDSLGRHRDEEFVFDEEDFLVATHGIETHTEELAIEEGVRDVVDGAGEFVEALLESTKLRQCAARTLLRFHAMRREGGGDRCTLDDQAERAQNEPVRDLLVGAIANEDIFWRRN